MIQKKVAEAALAAALKTGGDFAEIFLQDERSSAMGMSFDRIEEAVTGRAHGAGVRVFKGLNSVYVYTNDTSLSGLLRAAERAADAVGTGNESRDVHLTGSYGRNIHAFKELPMDVPGANKAELLRRASIAAKSVSPVIGQVRAG